jgi:hypothetical protein
MEGPVAPLLHTYEAAPEAVKVVLVALLAPVLHKMVLLLVALTLTVAGVFAVMV